MMVLKVVVQIMWENSYEVAGAPPVEDQRFTVKTVYDYLRAKGKSVPTGKPQVVGHKVDLCNLAKLAFENLQLPVLPYFPSIRKRSGVGWRWRKIWTRH
jgi:hypothetical protein